VDQRSKRLAFVLGTSIVLAFALFCVSVAVLGSWWRFEGMPAPEEWSALFGASALVALGFAWYQVRQVDQSNRELIASNALARRVNIEAVRPRVQVTLEATRAVRKARFVDANAPGGSVYLTVENVGASSAHNVRLRVDTPFTSLEEFFKADMMVTHFAGVNKFFDGSVSFETLSPGKKYIWFIGRVPRLFDEETDLPHRWEIEAEYEGTINGDPFHDTSVIDLDLEKRVGWRSNPLERIGKDIEVVGDELKKLNAAGTRSLTSLGGVISKALQTKR
jgi:hypothetical protein